MRSARNAPNDWKTIIFNLIFGKYAENSISGKVGRQFRILVAVSMLVVALTILYTITLDTFHVFGSHTFSTPLSSPNPISDVRFPHSIVDDLGFIGTSPTPNPELHCFHVTGHETTRQSALHFNARTACLLRTTCLTPRTSMSDRATLFVSPYVTDGNATCTGVRPNFNEFNGTGALDKATATTCDQLWRETRCAHGHYSQQQGDESLANCADVQPLSKASYKAEWLDGVSIILPSYKYLQNKYHFVQAFLPAVQVCASLVKLFSVWRETNPPREVNLIVRGGNPDEFGAWQASLTTAMIYFRLRRLGLIVTVLTTFEDDWFRMDSGTFWLDEPRKGRPFCTHSAILLGHMRDLTAWPFAGGLVADNWPFKTVNGTLSYATNGSVPVEAIVMRKTVYDYTTAKTIIPDHVLDTTDGSDAPPHLLLDLPPRRVIYSRRNHAEDPRQGEYLRTGTTRRFSDADEKWFVDMIRSTARAANFSVGVSETGKGVGFGDSVHQHRRAGVVIGISGVNLVDSMFAPAFSVLVEVAAHQLRCYINGGNAGLAFISYKPVRDATSDQSFCAPPSSKPAAGLTCTDKRDRRVMIDDPNDQKSLSTALRQAVMYVQNLHAAFEHIGGVPVKLNPQSARYVIDWAAASNSKR